VAVHAFNQGLAALADHLAPQLERGGQLAGVHAPGLVQQGEFLDVFPTAKVAVEALDLAFYQFDDAWMQRISLWLV
jgi:hypothetical protein